VTARDHPPQPVHAQAALPRSFLRATAPEVPARQLSPRGAPVPEVAPQRSFRRYAPPLPARA
jgi:hypothetical protein